MKLKDPEGLLREKLGSWHCQRSREKGIELQIVAWRRAGPNELDMLLAVVPGGTGPHTVSL